MSNEQMFAKSTAARRCYFWKSIGSQVPSGPPPPRHWYPSSLEFNRIPPMFEKGN